MFSQVYGELISETVPKVFDAIYYRDGISALFINDCDNIKKRNVLF